METNEINVRQKGQKITRREFVGGSAAAAAMFTIVPSSVLSSSAAAAPSQTVNLACIGVGDQGMGDMQDLMNVDGVQVVAVCDIGREVDYGKMGHGIAGLEPAIRTVNQHYAEEGKSGSYKGCAGYQDFREMLDKEGDNIDAVCIATPDHSGEGIRLTVEWIRDGALGNVREVHGGDSTGGSDWLTHRTRPKETPPVPDGWNWDLWCGPAPYRPYHPAYAPYNWRGWWAFGNGCIGDMACHNLDPAFWAFDLGAPTSVEATSSGITEETVADGAIYTYEFPAKGGRGPLTMKWYSGKEEPPRPKALGRGRRFDGGIYFVGDKGTIVCGGWASSPRIVPETKMKAYKRPPKVIPRLRGHHKGWIDAIKSGEQVHGGFDYSGPMTETVLLGAVALRTGKKLYWDSENMKATNAPEADKYIKPAFREGWDL